MAASSGPWKTHPRPFFAAATPPYAEGLRDARRRILRRQTEPTAREAARGLHYRVEGS